MNTFLLFENSNHLLLALITFLAAFTVTFIAVPAIIRISERRNIFDLPDERKVHTKLISRLGGIGIFAGFLASSVIWFFHNDIYQMSLLLVAFFILFIVGIADDLKGLSPRVKFAGQVLAAFIVAHAGMRIESLHGIFGIYDIPVAIQYAFTVFLVAGVVNAVNLIDGIDGLAGGLALIGSVFLSILMISYGDWGFALLGLSLAGALLAFLRYNYHPAKIFMGDTGSILLGFALAILGIRVIAFADGVQSSPGQAPIVILVFGALLVPVYDTIRVFAGRVLKKQSPFRPDRTHIHHLLIQCGYNHGRAAKILYTANIILIITAFTLRYQNPGMVIFLLIAEAILLTEFLTIRKIYLSLVRKNKAQEEITRIKGSNRFIVEHFKDRS